MRTSDPAQLLIVLLFAFSSASAQDVRDVPDPDPIKQLEQLEVADGFEINLFAAEPMIAKPVRMAWDERGRLWVVGTTTYPQPEPGKAENDKIYVLEDTDRDGRADTSIVFADGLQMPTGIAIGNGGVFVGNSNELLHLKDTDRDGRADERRVVFRGFGQDDTHHLINTFRWGADGALYFNQGIYTYSNVETPWGMRRLHGGGIWRMDPRQRRLDVYTRGMINPWGHEFDAWGQSFATDGADYQGIYYLFPGAQFNAALGADRILAGLNADQPKYAGLEVLSGRHLPDSLQGDVLTNDYRANRVKRFVLSEDGSGYRSQDAGPFVWSRHVAFRPVDIRMGPDGAIYIADWYNPIIQHGEIDFRDPRRDQEHGRIWRITAKGRPLVEPPNLEGAAPADLLDALALPEQWTRREARRLLRERGAAEVEPALHEWIARLDTNDEHYERLLLEALWVAQSVDMVDEDLLLRVLQSQDPRARAAAVRVLSAWHESIPTADELLTDAVDDDPPGVRLEAVIALRGLGTADAARTALHVLDAPMDRFLDHALWITMQALEPFWLERLTASPDFFGDDAKLVFALKTSREPYAIARLGRMLGRGDVPASHRSDVLDAIANYGSPADLQIVFERAIAVGLGDADAEATMNGADQGDADAKALELLSALERAARRDAAPADEGSVIQAMGSEADVRTAGRPAEGLDRITRLLGHEDDGVAASAARLTGLWGLTALRGELIQMAEASSSSAREASVEALAALGDAPSKQALVDMTGPDRPIELRLLAAATLAEIDLDRAARTAVELFEDLPNADGDARSEGAAPVFRAILAHEDGTHVLAAALEDADIPTSVARTGLEVIRSKGWRWRDSNAHAADLQQALEAISGPLPPPPVPQNPSTYQLHRLELDAKAEGDPAAGELVYRKSELTCQTCHAIGGAGGQSGPDLSSIGATAPVDYIIEAVLMPDNAVKDGFSPLMPAGLTASLEEGEFLDLIRFMSELGVSDAFTAQPGWVRRWRVAADNEAAARVIEEGGPDGFVEQEGELWWQPRYSMVSGELPLDDLPIIANKDDRVSIIRSELDVSRAGTLDLHLGSGVGLSLWVGHERIVPQQEVVSIDLQDGRHSLTLVVDRDVRAAPLAVRVLSSSSADVQSVMGE